jgi:hypothetical protein
VTNARYITQEDQCFDAETKHTTQERSFVFVAGESSVLDISQTRCFISYDYSSPTSAPSNQPSSEPSSTPSLAPSDSNDSFCGACLSDGEYIFRSTGACDPYGEDVSWDFCGVSGNAQTEFHFWMEDGVCYPGVFGESCGTLSSHPSSQPSAEPSSLPSDQPVSSAPSTLAESAAEMESDEEDSLLSDANLLVSVSVVFVVIITGLVGLGCHHFFGAFWSLRGSAAKPALAINPLGTMGGPAKKVEEAQANLSICLDIVDSDDDGLFHDDAWAASEAARKPIIAGTFVEEDVSLFDSDVFS